MLYELLTGTTPFDKRALALRRPTTKSAASSAKRNHPARARGLARWAAARTATAAHRLVDSNRLSQLVRGDLDWIVMKALEKDRNRRYETADGLARDIQRYLSDQPVEACPPSATYRFRKFARRNRVGLTMAVLVSASLVLGTVVSTWQAIRATRAERLAEAARTAEAEQRTEAEKQREQADANFQKARKTVDEYFTLVSESKLLDVPGLQPLRTDLLEAALRLLPRALGSRIERSGGVGGSGGDVFAGRGRLWGYRSQRRFGRGPSDGPRTRGPTAPRPSGRRRAAPQAGRILEGSTERSSGFEITTRSAGRLSGASEADRSLGEICRGESRNRRLPERLGRKLRHSR